MKSQFFILLFFCISLNINVSAQADLTLVGDTIFTSSLNTGDLFFVECFVKNIGNQTAGDSHLKVFISPTTNTNDAVKGTSVSIEALGPNAISQLVIITFRTPQLISTGSYYVLFSIDDRN